MVVYLRLTFRSATRSSCASCKSCHKPGRARHSVPAVWVFIRKQRTRSEPRMTRITRIGKTQIRAHPCNPWLNKFNRSKLRKRRGIGTTSAQRDDPNGCACLALENRIACPGHATVNRQAKEARLPCGNRGQPPGRQGQETGEQAHPG